MNDLPSLRQRSFVVIVIFLIIFVFSTINLISTFLFTFNAREAQGQVIVSQPFKAIIEYEVDGQKLQFSESMKRSFLPGATKYTIGTPVNVIYDPSNPQKGRLKDRIWIFPIIMFIVSLIGVLGSFFS